MKRPLLLTTVTLLVVTVAGSVGWLSRSRIPQVAQVVTDCEVAGPGANCGVMGDGVCAEMQTCNEWGGCGNGTFTTDWIACTPQVVDPGCPPDPGTCQNGTCVASWNASNGQACSMGDERMGTCFEGSCNCAWDDCVCDNNCPLPDPCADNPNSVECNPPYCGNDTCDEGENKCSCAVDCGEPAQDECKCRPEEYADPDEECKTFNDDGCNDDGTKCCAMCQLADCSDGEDNNNNAEFYGSLGMSGNDDGDLGCYDLSRLNEGKIIFNPAGGEQNDPYAEGLIVGTPDMLQPDVEIAALPPDAHDDMSLIGSLFARHLTGVKASKTSNNWKERARACAEEGGIPMREIVSAEDNKGKVIKRDVELVICVYALPQYTTPNFPNIRTGDKGGMAVDCHEGCYEVTRQAFRDSKVVTDNTAKAFRILQQGCVVGCFCELDPGSFDETKKDFDEKVGKREKEMVSGKMSRETALSQEKAELQAATKPEDKALHESNIAALEAGIKKIEEDKKKLEEDKKAFEKENTEGKAAAVADMSCYQQCVTGVNWINKKGPFNGQPRSACADHDPDCCRATCVGDICKADTARTLQPWNPPQMPQRGGGGGGQQGGGGGGSDGGGGEEETESGDEGGDTGGGSGSGGGGGGGNNGGTGGGSSQSSVVRLSSAISSVSALSSKASTLSVRSASSVRSSLSSMRSSVASVRSASSLMSVGASSVRLSSQPITFFSSRASSLTVTFSRSSDITVIFLQSSDRPASSVMQGSSVLPFFMESSRPPIYVQRSISTDVLPETLRCGDGVRQTGEECDDGNGRDFDGCSRDCLLERGRCGDGIVQQLLGEQCEPSVHDPSLTYGCSLQCRFVSSLCGNGVADDGEQCDQGPANSNAPNSYCRLDCGLARCGDGIVDTSSETCDDNNRLSGDGCSNVCKREQGAPTPLAAQLFEFPLLPQQQASVAWTPPLAQTWQALPPQTTTTGPASMAVMAAGAAGGVAWMRRKRKS